MARNQKKYQHGTGFHFYQKYKSYKYHHEFVMCITFFFSSFILLPICPDSQIKAAYLPKNTQTQGTLRPSTRICCFTYQVKFRWWVSRISRLAKFVRNLTQPEWRTQMQVSISWFAKIAKTQIGTNWRPAGVYKCWCTFLSFFTTRNPFLRPSSTLHGFSKSRWQIRKNRATGLFVTTLHIFVLKPLDGVLDFWSLFLAKETTTVQKLWMLLWLFVQNEKTSTCRLNMRVAKWPLKYLWHS